MINSPLIWGGNSPKNGVQRIRQRCEKCRYFRSSCFHLASDFALFKMKMSRTENRHDRKKRNWAVKKRKRQRCNFLLGRWHPQRRDKRRHTHRRWTCRDCLPLVATRINPILFPQLTQEDCNFKLWFQLANGLAYTAFWLACLPDHRAHFHLQLIQYTQLIISIIITNTLITRIIVNLIYNIIINIAIIITGIITISISITAYGLLDLVITRIFTQSAEMETRRKLGRPSLMCLTAVSSATPIALR